MSNNTSLYSTTSTGNATIPPNNNTGLYNTTGVPQGINNNISVSGNIFAAGWISAVGNISGANFSTTGNVYADNVFGNIIGNLLVPGGSNEIVFNESGSACTSPAFTFNPSTNAVAITGTVSATGNITGAYILGNGSQLTGLPATYSNANVATFLADFGSNAISTTGNITAGYFVGDGSQLTNLPVQPGTYGNANVAAYLPTYTGALTAANISTTGNTTSAYFIGDGSQLTNLPLGNYSNANVVNLLANFGSNVISTTGNITGDYIFGNGSQLTGITANYSNANVVSLLAAFGSNTISTTGTVTAGNLIGDGSGLTNITAANIVGTVANATYAVSAGVANSANSVAGANVTGTVANAAYASQAAVASTANSVAGGNVTGQVANALIAGTVYTNAQPNITSVGTLTSLSSSGNISGVYIIGDGSQLTNLPIQPGTYSNANVANYLPVYSGAITASSVSATGNVQGAFLKGDGSQITNLPLGNYSNANVAAFLPVYTGDYAGGNISVSGNVTGNILKTSGSSGNIVGANYVSANFYLGDGGLLSNISSGNYSNANVAAYLPTYTGNIGAGNLILTTNSGVAYVNNITGLAGQPVTITADGTEDIHLDADSIRIGDNNANATIVTKGTGDLILTTNEGAANQGNIRLFDGANGNIDLNPNGSGQVRVASDATVTGNVTATYFIGNGSTLSSITGANVTGTVANATYAVSAGSATSATDAAQANYANIANSVSGSNVSGQVANALVAGTVYVNAQPNITSVGTLSVLNTSGNISAAGNITGSYIFGNGSQLTGITGTASNSFSTISANGTNIVAVTSTDTLTLTAGSGIAITGNAATDTITIAATGGGGGSPGGANTQIQYNDASAFAGNAQMTFNNTTGNVAFGNLIIRSTNPNNVAVITNTNSLVPTQTPKLAKIAIGSGYDGDYGNTGDLFLNGRNSAIQLTNRYTANTNLSTPVVNTAVTSWFDNASANAITNNPNVRGLAVDTYFTGNRWTAGGSNVSPLAMNGLRVTTTSGNGVSGGNVGTLTSLAVVLATNGNNSVVNDAITILNQGFANISGANTPNVYGMTFNYSSTNVTTSNVYLLHNQVNGSGTHNTGWGIGGNYRSASRYFFIRNDDDVSQVRLGSLRNYHEYTANVTSSSGSLTLNPRSGPVSQVQSLYPTENITSVTFSGFITNANDGTNNDAQVDTLTLIITQGATPYTITMPTGNAQIKYASGTTTVPATANSVCMMAVSAYYNFSTAAVNYLVTISPEFT